jgi:hypothetical protein
MDVFTLAMLQDFLRASRTTAFASRDLAPSPNAFKERIIETLGAD